MEVLEFVPVSAVDPVYLDTSYYVLPEAAGERPYTLLFETMRRSGYVSIAQLTMHNREHTVVIRPGRFGLLVHTMYYPDEVRAVNEFRTDPSQVHVQELELASLLVNALAASFEPAKYRDTYRENLRALIDAKTRGQEVVDGATEPALAPTVDILDALRASLARAKKPMAVPVALAAVPAAHNGAGAGTRRKWA